MSGEWKAVINSGNRSGVFVRGRALARGVFTAILVLDPLGYTTFTPGGFALVSG